MAVDHTVLDAAQLKRIEAVHRGFLYQHLYAVACFFNAEKAGVTAISVESDEDVELERPGRRDYLQIKTRANVLTRVDIEGALERFALLRVEHESKKRKRTPAFSIISNVTPGPNLLAEMEAKTWPGDVAIYWPGNEPKDAALPKTWPDLIAAAARCAELASSIPLGALLPETLILKLAGLVLAASAGQPPRADHKFIVEELPTLFEQMALQLQEFPAPPARYRPLASEPSLVSDTKLRAIVGLSGAGKTAWVAQAIQLSTGDTAYFDVGDTPSAAVAIPLARELAGRFFGSGGGLGSIILPGATGFDMLRALDKRLSSEEKQTLVVIDNAHHLEASDLLAVTDLMPGTFFLLLSQPGQFVESLKALRNVAPEVLNGWEVDTIAAEAADAKCIITADSAAKTLELTGGLPLYVQNAVIIAAAEYKGRLADFCRDIFELTHNVATAQELILSKTFKSLSASIQNILAVLSQSDIALARSEATAVCKVALGINDKAFAAAVRELRTIGAIEIFGVDSIKVHDAMRVLGRTHLSNFSTSDIDKARKALREVVYKSLTESRSPQKFSLYIRILGEMGDIRTLTQFALDELFHELGAFNEIADVLDKASSNAKIAPDERFAALDGLIFNDLRMGKIEDAAKRLAMMEKIAAEHKLDDTDLANYGNKIMLHASQVGDKKLVDEQSEKLKTFFPNDPMRDRILRYNIAHANFKIGREELCIVEVKKLIKEYYSELGITPADVTLKNPDKIWPLLDKSKDHTDSLKHLADSLDLLAQSSDRLGMLTPNERITAMKYYSMVNALESVVRVGQDLVDEFVRRHDYIGARQILESTIIPNVMGLKMTEYVLPVRRHYAVVLAYCGEHDKADAEMAKLAPYEAGLEPIHLKEYRAQLDLLAELRTKAPPRQWQMPGWLSNLANEKPVVRKVGRNDLCPCGSTIKYKKCCGKN